MSKLKIRIFKAGEAEPETTVTIPLQILRIAQKLIPSRAAAALNEHGVDLDELVRLSEAPDVQGTVVEIEDHKRGERVVVALE